MLFNPNQKTIQIYLFHEAPQELQDLSRCGGDEDYIMLVPPSVNFLPYFVNTSEADEYCSRFDPDWRNKCNDEDSAILTDILPFGWRMYLWSHA
jgi:hypothetical protein